MSAGLARLGLNGGMSPLGFVPTWRVREGLVSRFVKN